MSQYPPYQPPGYPNPYGYMPYMPDPGTAAARKAGVLLIVLGAVNGLLGLLMAFVGQIRAEQLPPEQAETWRQLEQQMAELGFELRSFLMSIAIVAFVIALLLIVLGIVVRKAGRGAVVTAIVITSILILGSAFLVLANLVTGDRNPMGICMFVVLGGLYVLALVWLIQGLKASPGAAMGYPGQYPGYPPGYGGMGYGPLPGAMPSPPAGQAPIHPPQQQLLQQQPPQQQPPWQSPPQ